MYHWSQTSKCLVIFILENCVFYLIIKATAYNVIYLIFFSFPYFSLFSYKMTCLLAKKKRVLVVIQEVVVMLQMIIDVCTAMSSYFHLPYERRLECPNSVYRV